MKKSKATITNPKRKGELSEAEVHKLTYMLEQHYGEPVRTVTAHCQILQACGEAWLNSPGYKEMGMMYRQLMSGAVRKSNLMARVLYGHDDIRTEQCPIHKGVWSGLEHPDHRCPHGCGFTGWIPTTGRQMVERVFRAYWKAGKLGHMASERPQIHDKKNGHVWFVFASDPGLVVAVDPHIEVVVHDCNLPQGSRVQSVIRDPAEMARLGEVLFIRPRDAYGRQAMAALGLPPMIHACVRPDGIPTDVSL